MKQLFLFFLVVLAFAPSNNVVRAIQLRHGSGNGALSTGGTQSTLQAKFLLAEPTKEQKPSPQIGVGTTANSLPEAVDKLKEDYGNLPRWLQIVLCVVGIVVGLVLVFAGYHFFKLSIFLITGGLVGVLMFVILDHSFSDSVHNKVAIVYGISVGVGLLAGVVAVCLIRAAVFAVGAAAGVLLAVFLNPVALKYVWPAVSNKTVNLFWLYMVSYGTGNGVLHVHMIIQLYCLYRTRKRICIFGWVSLRLPLEY